MKPTPGMASFISGDENLWVLLVGTAPTPGPLVGERGDQICLPGQGVVKQIWPYFSSQNFCMWGFNTDIGCNIVEVDTNSHVFIPWMIKEWYKVHWLWKQLLFNVWQNSDFHSLKFSQQMWSKNHLDSPLFPFLQLRGGPTILTYCGDKWRGQLEAYFDPGATLF